MLGLSSIGARLVVVASSAAIHASVFVAFAGHGPALAASSAAPVDLEIQVETQPLPREVPAPEPVALPEHHHAHAVPHSHVHPYPVPASHDTRPHDPSLVHVPVLGEHDNAPRTAPPSALPPPEQIAAPAPAMVRFAMPPITMPGTASTSLGSFGGGTGIAATGNGAGDGPPIPEAAASIPARLLRGGTPPYPVQARAEEIEADVPLEIVVDPSGHVTDAHVVRHVGYGFDDAALRAARSFRFSPAQRDGHAVRVRMKWSVVFRLK